MMKKCLVLMLVLGIASMATAGLTFSNPVPPSPNLQHSVATVDLVADAGTAGSNSTTDFVGAVASVTGGAGMEAQAVNPQAAYPGYYQTIMGSTNGAIVLGEVVSIVTLDTSTLGTFTIYSYTAAGWSAATTNDSYTYKVIPEPMTIGLLGLGGLFLRRRK